MLEFMSDAQTPAVASKSLRDQYVEEARAKLGRYVGRAVEILEELAEGAENERVRLAAADSILDRAGVGKSTNTQVTVNTDAEHEAARREAEEYAAALARNKGAVHTQGISLEALIVHEGGTAS